MRLLLVSNMYPSKSHPNYGVFVKNFYRNFSRDGDIEIVGKSLIRGKGRNIFEKIIKYLFFTFRTVLMGIVLKYDFIYVHYVNHSLFPVKILLLFKKKPLILNFHGGDFFTNNLFSKYVSRLVTPQILESRLIIAPSQYLANEIAKKYNQDLQKFFVSPSAGVDLKKFTVKKKSTSAIATLGYVGRIDKGKGWELFIDLIHKFLCNRADIRGIAVGGGKDYSRFQSIIKNKNLTRVISHYGLLPQSELPKIYQTIDVLIFPSYSESLGLVGLEAMACGTPVIGSNIEGIASYLIDGYNGFLFKVGSLEDLHNQTKRFLALSNERQAKMEENAVNTAKSHNQEVVQSKLKRRLLYEYNKIS